MQVNKMYAQREHEICTGHRVVGQGGKCERIHGHGYVVKFCCEADKLNSIGMVVDFGVIKSTLCQWLEDNWDHKFLVWKEDPFLAALHLADPEGVVVVPFNPTAENMAQYLVEVVGPKVLNGTAVKLSAVHIEETRKCSVMYEVQNV